MNDVAVLTVSDEEIAVAKATLCKDATDAEMKLFFFDCHRNGVHPLDRLIHFTKRGGRYVPVTSIDLFRIRAESTGVYGGQDDAVVRGDPKKPGFSASVTVYRIVGGVRVPFATGTARWEEYLPDNSHTWMKMPHVMLSKCAEALALRKAFPKQLHGLYIKEEMEQADNKTGPTTPTLQGNNTKAHLKALLEEADAAPPRDDVVVDEPPPKKPDPPKGGYKARPREPEPEQQTMPTPTDQQLLDFLTQLHDIPVIESQRANDVMAKAATQSWMDASWTQLEDYFYGKWTCFTRPQAKKGKP